MPLIMKTWIYALILIIGMNLSGCISHQPKIGFLLHGYDSPRWTKDEQFFVDAVKRLKGTVIVKDAGNSQEMQIKQANELIDEGVSVLVVIPVDLYVAGKIVDLAHENEIKVIAYDRMINNCPLDYYVSADNLKIGELQAKSVAKIKPQGNYALIGGAPFDNNSRMVYVGQMNVLQPLVDNGAINIAYMGFGRKWSGDEGYRLAMNSLDITSNKIDAILCGNDAMALGAIKALKERGLGGEVAVAGQDADLPNIQEIIAGNQTMTVFKKIRTMAQTAAELAMHLYKKEAVEASYTLMDNGYRLVPSYLVDSVPVDINNIKMTVVAEGFQQENEIFKKK
jgi:D-xylose transport system substrate-binding protein